MVKNHTDDEFYRTMCIITNASTRDIWGKLLSQEKEYIILKQYSQMLYPE